MTCLECGAENAEATGVCARCGAPVSLPVGYSVRGSKR